MSLKMARWKESCVGKMHSMLMRLEAHFGVWLPVCNFATSRWPAAAAASAAATAAGAAAAAASAAAAAAASAAAAATAGAEKENELQNMFFFAIKPP